MVWGNHQYQLLAEEHVAIQLLGGLNWQIDECLRKSPCRHHFSQHDRRFFGQPNVHEWVPGSETEDELRHEPPRDCADNAQLCLAEGEAAHRVDRSSGVLKGRQCLARSRQERATELCDNYLMRAPIK
jgi:hypothetical protein